MWFILLYLELPGGPGFHAEVLRQCLIGRSLSACGRGARRAAFAANIHAPQGVPPRMKAHRAWMFCASVPAAPSGARNGRFLMKRLTVKAQLSQ